MNKERRKALDSIRDDVGKLNKELEDAYAEANAAIGAVNEAITKINDLRAQFRDDWAAQISELKDEEQEYYDNMPEGFQNGDKGSVAQEAIDAMDNAITFLEGLDDIEELSELEPPDVDGEAAQSLEEAANVG